MMTAINLVVAKGPERGGRKLACGTVMKAQAFVLRTLGACILVTNTFELAAAYFQFWRTIL